MAQIKKKKTVSKKKKSSSKTNRTTLSSAKKITNKKKKVTTTKKKTVTSAKKKNTNSSKKKTNVSKTTNNKQIKQTKITKINEVKPIIENKQEDIKKEIKHKKKKYYQVYVFVLFVLVYTIYCVFFTSTNIKIKKVYIDENNKINIIIKNNKYKFNNKLYCFYTNEDITPTLNDKNWKIIKNNNCNFEIDDNIYYAYIKNEDNIIVKVKEVSKLGKVTEISINKEKLYLPLNDTYQLNIDYKKIGYVDETIIWESENEEIASVSDGKVTSNGYGTTKIKAKIHNATISSEVNVTNLIVTRPKTGYDFNKSNLTCKKYSTEENELLDQILKDRINDVGYKTRAGVVEAARFLTLDFPYRINYFYENGRQTTNNVDGEGRYYHTGLYLSESKYSSITGSQYGPKMWGCSMYDRPIGKNNINGLDCSGFVSWALLNGGFDVKDVGAGWSNKLDLTDYGEVRKITSSLINSNVIKVGDLLHSTKAGGHIGIIVGLDSTYYYVAQALWYNEVGVIITPIKKSKLSDEFPHVVLMDKYYKEDGKLTNMW